MCYPVQLIKMVLGLLYLMHILGCFWFYLAAHPAEGVDATWLSTYDDGSGLDAPTEIQYLYSVYWALMTLTTVGYGDITPANDAERSYALLALLVGALVFGYMLSSIGDLIASLDKNGGRVQDKLDEVKEFTRWHKMPPDLAARVRKYYEYIYTRQGPLDDGEIVGQLAPALNHDVMEHLLAQTVCRIPFFYVPALGSKADDEDAPADVQFQLALYPHLKPLVRETHEIVFDKGDADPSPVLTFLFKGAVEAFGAYDGGRKLYSITETGTFLSEHVLYDVPSTMRYQAAHGRAELYVIELSALLSLLERFPHARDEFAHFCIEDAISHQRKRTWALRFAVREKYPEGLDEHGLQAQRHARAALLLQVAWLRRSMSKADALLEEHAHYAPLLPTLYGAVPKAHQLVLERKRERRFRRTQAGSAAAMRAYNAGGGSIGVLPFNGALTPRSLAAMSPRSAAAIHVSVARAQVNAIFSPTPASGAPAAASTNRSDGGGGGGGGEAHKRKARENSNSSGGGGGGSGSSSRGGRTSSPTTARQVMEQLKALPAGFRTLEQQMDGREKQLQAIHDTLAKLAESAGRKGNEGGAASPPAGQPAREEPPSRGGGGGGGGGGSAGAAGEGISSLEVSA